MEILFVREGPVVSLDKRIPDKGKKEWVKWERTMNWPRRIRNSEESDLIYGGFHT